MTREEQLKEIILSKHKSIRSFCLSIDMPVSTMDSMLKRGIDRAGVASVIKVFDALGLDVESLTDESIKERETPPSKTDDGLIGETVELFGQLTDREQRIMIALAKSLLSNRE